MTSTVKAPTSPTQSSSQTSSPTKRQRVAGSTGQAAVEGLAAGQLIGDKMVALNVSFKVRLPVVLQETIAVMDLRQLVRALGPYREMIPLARCNRQLYAAAGCRYGAHISRLSSACCSSMPQLPTWRLLRRSRYQR